MAKHLCPNTASDQTNYSAPVPFIGLYIAVATLVCFLLILCDVIHGFRRRKTWFPCHFFALNSVTLTLLGIAAKLPVDLTTSMPSAYDQLSKLIGTALICVSIGFLFPSLGSSGASECVTNTAAITILVVTIVVNICIQISTGIIFSFVPEHVIIMFCMLTMLIQFSALVLSINNHKEIQMDRKKELLRNGLGSMLRRLKLCYLHAYDSEPQFVLCRTPINMLVGGPCLLCLVVVLQALFRSLIGHELGFCNGLSDYGWSIKIIVLTQILVILLASLAIGIRWHISYKEAWVELRWDRTLRNITSNRPFLIATIGDYIQTYFNYAIIMGEIITIIVFTLPCMLIFFIIKVADKIIELCCSFFKQGNTELEGIQEYKDFLKENSMELSESILTKCVKDIKIWMSGSQKSNSTSHLVELLSKRPPSQQSLHELNRQYGFKEVSCLYLVFLVRLVSVSTPSTLNGHLVGCLSEVFDTVYFIDSTMNSLKTNNRRKCKLAKAMCRGKDFKIVISKESQSDVHHAREIIKETTSKLSYFVRDEVCIIVKLINDREYASIQELHDYMEQLFIDMLHIFLVQLPHAIFKELMECNVEAYQETVGRVLKLLCQIKHVEDKVEWSFPVGSHITRLITAEASVTNQHITSPLVHNDSSNVVASHVIEDEDHNVRNAHLHKIVEIE